MSKRDKYNSYLRELVIMGYGKCTAETLPLEQRTKLAEIDFYCSIETVDEMIRLVDYNAANYYGERAFNKFIFWYANKNIQILNKHCKS